ncbi:MAG: AmmeMemoRadiSam system protein A [Phycisphaerae bacterium]
MLSDTDKKTLLRIARETVEATVRGGSAPAVPVESEALTAPCGAFVTLRNHGRLRGCIGTFVARGPLHETVREMAAAALQDPRFLIDPVRAPELAEIDIEISVLSPLEKVDDPLREIELGRHGIRIDGPYGSGCFLPQVATETGWSLEEFLSQCCAGKAGLPRDAWMSPNVSVYRFEAEVFGEKDVGAGDS